MLSGKMGVVEDALHGGADGQEPGGVCIAHGLAKVVAKARAEHGQGQAGDILVGLEGDGEEGVDQSAPHSEGEGCQQGQQEIAGFQPHVKPPKAPIYIMPSTPSITTPPRSAMVPHKAPQNNGNR